MKVVALTKGPHHLLSANFLGSKIRDFINYALKEQVSLKTILRTSPEKWQAAVYDMRKVIRDLAGVEKTWQNWTGKALPAGCRKVVDDWKRVLDIRVPPGSEHWVQELVDYGRKCGIEVW